MIDVYVLAPERSGAAVSRFADEWLRDGEPAADEVEVPQYADDPDAVFESPDDAVEWLLARPHEPHGLYWRTPRGDGAAQAMLFFTTDGGLIAGLTVDDDAAAADWLRRLAGSVDARYGYVAFETPPPETAADFRAAAAGADPPRLVAGRIEEA